MLPEHAARFHTAALPDLAQAVYATDGSDDGVTPTRSWAAATREERRRAIERQPGRVALRQTVDGFRWTRVNATGEPCPITMAEAREEFRARGWAWDTTWEQHGPEDAG